MKKIICYILFGLMSLSANAQTDSSLVSVAKLFPSLPPRAAEDCGLAFGHRRAPRCRKSICRAAEAAKGLSTPTDVHLIDFHQTNICLSKYAFCFCKSAAYSFSTAIRSSTAESKAAIFRCSGREGTSTLIGSTSEI